MLEKYPAFTHARSTVIGLIAHFVPSLDGNDFDVVLNSFQCLKELRIISSQECAIQTFGSLIVAIHHKAEEKKHFIDDLLPLIFKALKDEWNASSAEWVLENQVLTVMNQEQLRQWIVELQRWIREDYLKYRLRVFTILYDIFSKGSHEMKEYIRSRFSEEFLVNMIESCKKSTSRKQGIVS